jgi:N-acetyl-anhydromuramyl-L-alanine amidase AmpD
MSIEMHQMYQSKEFRSEGVHKDKSQIVLCHTSREVEEYLTSLKFRYNGKYNKIPHYIISREGEIIQTLELKRYSNFFPNKSVNEKAVIISLENLGWLERKPLSSDYINWKGSIYKGKVFEKKWRDFFFWEPYTEKQLETLSDLCLKICDEVKIPKVCSGHNTKIEGIGKFSGIVSRSNYDSKFTDLNPSFSFENFIKTIEHEQLS